MQPVEQLPNSILSLSGQTADRLLALGDGDAALVYLSLLRRGEAAGLKLEPARLQAAMDKLASAGLISSAQARLSAQPVQPEPEVPVPEYSIVDVTAALSAQSTFSGLADEVERRLGKKLSTPDLKTLLVLYDHLALPAEVILLIVSWCMQEVTRKYGSGRKPFLSQIRREAFRWAQQGIDTAEAAEEHLRRLLRLRTKEGEVIRLLDLPNRPLVDREQKYIAAWLDMGFDNDTLRLAYEKTVMGTASKSMDWRYMHKILTRWHEKGLHSVAQIQEGDRAPQPPRKPGSRSAIGTTPGVVNRTPDRQAQEDMERMRRYMEKMKQEQGG